MSGGNSYIFGTNWDNRKLNHLKKMFMDFVELPCLQTSEQLLLNFGENFSQSQTSISLESGVCYIDSVYLPAAAPKEPNSVPSMLVGCLTTLSLPPSLR